VELKPDEIAAIVNIARREIAADGGRRRAKKLTKKRRSEIARIAARARWAKERKTA